MYISSNGLEFMFSYNEVVENNRYLIQCRVALTVIQLCFAEHCTAQTSDENKWLTRVYKSFAEIS